MSSSDLVFAVAKADGLTVRQYSLRPLASSPRQKIPAS